MLTVSHLKEEDIASVVEIENLSFSAPKDESIFRGDQNKYLVVKRAGKIVGYVGLEKVLGETHIINMAVHPDFRGKGIGKKLLEEVLKNKDVFFLEVRVSNVSAQKLYEKYGFKNVGIRKNYYQDNGEGAYIMRREPGE